jgi:hypothetical protein
MNDRNANKFDMKLYLYLNSYNYGSGVKLAGVLWCQFFRAFEGRGSYMLYG